MSSPRPAGAATTMAHTCQAKRCPVEVPPSMFMCQPHWFMVSPALREAIKGSYRPGRETDEYLAVARAAIDQVDHKESRAADRRAATRPPCKPVQLALFDLADPS